VSRHLSRGERTKAGHPPALPAWRPDWLVAVLAAVGFGIAGYLTVTKLAGGGALFCKGVGGCEVVQQSRYATLLGVPTAAWGALVYAAIGTLAVTGLGARRWLAAFLLAVAAVAFSGYLTYLELFVIGAVCWYCVASAAAATAVLAVLLGRRSAVVGPRRFLRPGRVVGLGVLTALVAVVFGLAIFAVTGPGGAPAYQEALARHLAQSGAIMYGAFW
jgi:uncharacterized membrane protein